MLQIYEMRYKIVTILNFPYCHAKIDIKKAAKRYFFAKRRRKLPFSSIFLFCFQWVIFL